MSEGARVLELLSGQLAKYRQMVSLVAGQPTLFASMDVDAILGLIERKRAILAEIEAAEAGLAPVKADWARARAGFTPDEARAIDQTLRETEGVLGELVRLEDGGRDLLERQRQAKTAQLGTLMRNSQARGAYGAR